MIPLDKTHTAHYTLISRVSESGPEAETFHG